VSLFRFTPYEASERRGVFLSAGQWQTAR